MHDVLMNSLQDQINNIERGQDEVKDLIVTAHKESLNHIQVSTEKNRQDIADLRSQLRDEIEKVHERDREYLIAINDLKIKHGLYTGVGISAATILTFLLNMSRVAEIIVK